MPPSVPGRRNSHEGRAAGRGGARRQASKKHAHLRSARHGRTPSPRVRARHRRPSAFKVQDAPAGASKAQPHTSTPRIEVVPPPVVTSSPSIARRRTTSNLRSRTAQHHQQPQSRAQPPRRSPPHASAAGCRTSVAQQGERSEPHMNSPLVVASSRQPRRQDAADGPVRRSSHEGPGAGCTGGLRSCARARGDGVLP